jgi:hypothetical protein
MIIFTYFKHRVVKEQTMVCQSAQTKFLQFLEDLRMFGLYRRKLSDDFLISDVRDMASELVNKIPEPVIAEMFRDLFQVPGNEAAPKCPPKDTMCECICKAVRTN